MRISHRTLDGKIYDYTESIWSGKKALTVDGVPALKFNKNEFKIGDEVFAVKGSFLSGVKLVSKTNSANVIVLAKNTWYEWILIFAPFVFWGITVIPLIGGWMWSLIGAAIGCPAIARTLRSEMNNIFKIFVSLLIWVLIFAFWLVATMFFTGLITGLV